MIVTVKSEFSYTFPACYEVWLTTIHRISSIFWKCKMCQVFDQQVTYFHRCENYAPKIRC